MSRSITRNMGYAYEHECPDGSYLTIDCDLTFDVLPGEPMVRYYPDGSGYPGSQATAELTEVRVFNLSGEHWNLDRSMCPELFRFFDKWIQQHAESDWQEYFFDHVEPDYGPED